MIICAFLAAAANGIRHIKLTGGEPLVRKGLPDLVRILKAVDGIEKVTLTTNGVLLGLYLPELIGAGLDAVNISLDTTDRQKYKELTGSDELNTVMSAIHIANELDIRVKVNAVSLDLGEANIRNLIEIARQDPIDVRFIEMMPIGFGKNFETVNHRDLFKKLETMYSGIMIDEREHGFAANSAIPATEYASHHRDTSRPASASATAWTCGPFSGRVRMGPILIRRCGKRSVRRSCVSPVSTVLTSRKRSRKKPV